MGGTAPECCRLPPGEVDVWCAALDQPAATAARLHAMLSAEERKRSARFRFPRDRRRFVTAHGVLRELLGRYLEAPAEAIGYAWNAFGKPELAGEFAGQLEFNLAHSAGLALIAFARAARVGVDLEYLQAQADYAEIAEEFFAPAETEQLNRLSPPHYAEAFLACWTKKEAYLKASGEGLLSELNSFSVPLGGPVAAEAAVDDKNWSFFTLRPAPGYIGALVVAGGGWRLSERHWRARHE